MVFSSIVFLFYFLPLFLAVFLLSGFSKYALMFFSLVFYAWGEPVFLPLILIMIALNFWLGRAIERGHDDGRSRLWVTVGIVVNLLPLAVFKYGMFLLHILSAVLGHAMAKFFGASVDQFVVSNIPLPLPLGISFYTFHSLSYLIDVYRKDVRAERSIRDLAVYISMFPQLIAGPIIRYKTIAGELHKPVISAERFATGIRYFVIGLSQKVLIANTVAASADPIFALPPDQLSTPLAWLGIVCYTLQIYFDFGGYSNMAIGLGLMIGFTFPVNFNYPYISSSVTEFWRRWHISLSSWFRDYLYIPLGGNRVSPWRTYFNLWVVFLLCGLWHGAALNFVIWGAAHGCFLVLERAGFSRVLERIHPVFRHGYVLLAVMMTWVLFRADTLGAARYYFGALIGFGSNSSLAPPLHRFLGVDVVLALAAGIITSGPYGNRAMIRVGELLRVGAVQIGELAGLVALFALVTLSVAGGAYNPFIYFRF
jgi:alginate O-acetyltransferase complex protein AlgI